MGHILPIIAFHTILKYSTCTDTISVEQTMLFLELRILLELKAFCKKSLVMLA